MPPRAQFPAAKSATLDLTGSREGFAEARDFTHRTLDDWQLDHCLDDAVMVVTELAANAVLHALPHADTCDVRLRLTLRPAHLMCAVTDQSDDVPVYPPTVDPLLEHGRGLRIVEALSEHWGWTKRSPVGKTVWAMLATRGPA
ncbi:ATP-binding protein [Streptomyces roseirectus]|uniref:ATP-binding protein n=1 Tax=Streptomyces roseirectus TaxID=2768066 RepID=A0A7H0INQ6_9ACTN|nr:ATP-binding protein [Streptomyces roseirectus]QNP74422.1 ATP-binding protein [Streptomyces roseirectus]